MRAISRLAILALACLAPCEADANAGGTISIEKVEFRVASADDPAAAVSGELRVPASDRGLSPAVLILHGSAGIDGRGAFYAESLNQAGIATLEIDLFRGRGRPVTTRHNMPHAYGSLRYLANHPRIDPVRIGIMGFSWGGIISVLTSSDELTREYTAGSNRFAAHLGIYPVCWSHRSVAAGSAKYFPASTYRSVTGMPVHILTGDKDDYDDPDGCQKFLAELPAGARRHFSLTVYPGATHMWETRAGGDFFDNAAHNGKGGYVKVVADPDIARQSREFAVAFFRRHLAADR